MNRRPPPVSWRAPLLSDPHLTRRGRPGGRSGATFRDHLRVISCTMRIKRRDEEFRDFYLRELGRLRSVALMMTGDPGKAAELTQEAMLRSYAAWGRIRGDDPGPYARRVLVNLCRNHYRRQRLELRKPHAPAGHTGDHSGTTDEALRVAGALSHLSPIRRATVVLRFYEDMTEAEIGRVLDRPVNTVKSDIRRSLESLRPLLEEAR